MWFKSKEVKLREEIEFYERELAMYQGMLQASLDITRVTVDAGNNIPSGVCNTWTEAVTFKYRTERILIQLNDKLSVILTKELDKVKQGNIRKEIANAHLRKEIADED